MPLQLSRRQGKDKPDATGSGVVIDEKGDILTNLHVIRSTDRWVVTFWDGSKSDAQVVNVQPENDLAVIKAKTAPDDLKPATLASTGGLNPGDTVVAVGFPFGLGPSVSSGVISGLKREFVDPDRKAGRGRPPLQPDPVRCGGKSRQFGRAAGQPRRRSGRHRHRDLQSHRPACLCRHGFCRADRECGQGRGRQSALEGPNTGPPSGRPHQERQVMTTPARIRDWSIFSMK